MKSETLTGSKRRSSGTVSPQYMVKNGRRMVVLAEAEYERLQMKADEWEPRLPAPNADGNYPAREYMLASIARDIIRRRLGLTPVELARRAGIRPETLNRIEQGKHAASVPTIDKIDRALNEAQRREHG